jgi:hypothetical protein
VFGIIYIVFTINVYMHVLCQCFRVGYMLCCTSDELCSKDDLANPSQWRIKYYTQTFDNFTSARTLSIYKIQCRLNTTADSLACQARQLQVPQHAALEFLCASADHTTSCNVQQALQCVSLTGVTILTATCCN